MVEWQKQSEVRSLATTSYAAVKAVVQTATHALEDYFHCLPCLLDKMLNRGLESIVSLALAC